MTQRLATATFYLVDNPGAPALALTRPNLGLSISKLIAEEVVARDVTPTRLPPQNGHLCSECCGVPLKAANPEAVKSDAYGSIVLSSMAVLELIKHHKTAWYIA
jgi:hypothetical protein